MSDAGVLERMRADWDEFAREDANYYVAFGRKGQDEEEFFATAADEVRSLREELHRLEPAPAAERRALEIGCGPGRLMRPMSRHFSEIHGVDVSGEMVRLARQRLRDIPNARVHLTAGADLAALPDTYFDFVYSYAVFQHIPSREVVYQYLAEAWRVLKPGGILRCQMNGLPDSGRRYTTWDGVRISAREISDFAREHDFQLLALEKVLTQYMWITCRKRHRGWFASLRNTGQQARIRSGASESGEPAIPARGPFSCASFWIEKLPEDCDLNGLRATIDGAPGRCCYIGRSRWDGLWQVNVMLPSGARTGLLPVEIQWLGNLLCPPAWIRVIPPGPSVLRIRAITDGVHLLSANRIESRTVKMVLENVADPDAFRATVDGLAVEKVEWCCTDPWPARYELNFVLPDAIWPGMHHIELYERARPLPPIPIEVV